MSNNLYLEKVRQIIHKSLEGLNYKLYLFGSQARGDFSNTSDIDIGVLLNTPSPPGILSRIREDLEESCIPYTVDLIDLNKVAPEFASHIKEEGILWTD